MPTYQYRCKVCNKIFDEFAKIKDRYKVRCRCGGDVEIMIVTRSVHVWKPYWEENITHQPVLVESKKHLKKLCKENDCVAHRLD